MRAALCARASTLEQDPENQLLELRAYVGHRGWSLKEYVDHGVSGTKESRPALDALLRDARRRRFDVLVVWRLDDSAATSGTWCDARRTAGPGRGVLDPRGGHRHLDAGRPPPTSYPAADGGVRASEDRRANEGRRS